MLKRLLGLNFPWLDMSGEFIVIVNMSGEHSPRRERVNFEPSSGATNIIHHVVQKIGDVGRMERLEIRRTDGIEGFSMTFPKPDDKNVEFK